MGTAPPDKPANIAPEFRKVESRQEYGKKAPIAGVQVLDLKRFVDDGGDFQELGRLDEKGELLALPGFKVRQVNYSVMHPGVVKAWHLHHKQEDVWFVPPQHRVLVGLLDCRDDSATKGQTMRLVLGDGRSQLLHIPRGVAHGACNLTGSDAVIVYMVNQQFSAAEPDEHRLPWDHVGKEFWDVTKG